MENLVFHMEKQQKKCSFLCKISFVFSLFSYFFFVAFVLKQNTIFSALFSVEPNAFGWKIEVLPAAGNLRIFFFLIFSVVVSSSMDNF